MYIFTGRLHISPRQILQDCENLGINAIGYCNDLYPSQLKDLDKTAPVLLYAMGNLSLLKNKKNVAIIGSRDISNEGLRAGKYITKQFVVLHLKLCSK